MRIQTQARVVIRWRWLSDGPFTYLPRCLSSSANVSFLPLGPIELFLYGISYFAGPIEPFLYGRLSTHISYFACPKQTPKCQDTRQWWRLECAYKSALPFVVTMAVLHLSDRFALPHHPLQCGPPCY